MPQPDPVAFTVFNIDIMWYAVMITVGIVLCVTVASFRAPKHDMTADNVLNLAIISIPVGIIGARIYYIIFNWDLYAGDFFKMINFREGGLAIHGGLIFGMATGGLLCYLWKIRPLNALDLVAPSIALAQSVGRWGNYFNSEAHGGPTDLPWAVDIDGIGYHPTFLYESIWCMLLFFVLIYVDNRRKFEGQVLLLYGILYSFERFWIEALRTDSLMIGPFKQAQVLSLTVIVVFTVIYVIIWKRNKGKDE